HADIQISPLQTAGGPGCPLYVLCEVYASCQHWLGGDSCGGGGCMRSWAPHAAPSGSAARGPRGSEPEPDPKNFLASQQGSQEESRVPQRDDQQEEVFAELFCPVPAAGVQPAPPGLPALLHLPGLSILTRPATNPLTSPAEEQQPIIHTTVEQDEQTMPPSMPKQQQDWATASVDIMSEHWHAAQIGILVACAYFKNKEGAYYEQTVYVMTDGKEQSAAITQAAVNQVVCYLLAEHDMDMRQLYMWFDGTLWCQDPVVRCQDPVVRCQDPVGQDPVDPVGQNPVVRCQDPVVWCQDPVVWCQDPVSQDPVVWCQDPVSQNPVVWCQDPVGVQQDPVVRYQDPVVPEPCGIQVEWSQTACACAQCMDPAPRGVCTRLSITKPFVAMPMFDQKRDDKHWDDECLTLLCSFAPDSVMQLCTLGKKLSVKMLNEYCKAVGLYVIGEVQGGLDSREAQGRWRDILDQVQRHPELKWAH
ncbi:hypothetical protein QJQ45_026326, partial [Haematococcus lacustris]